MSATNFTPDTTKEFKHSKLKSILHTCNSIAGMTEYKSACQSAVNAWEKSQMKGAENKVIFFKEALKYITAKLKRLTK